MIPTHCECGRPYPVQIRVRIPRPPKTHCIRGHELTPDNLMSGNLAQGNRACRTCHISKMRARNQVHREAYRKKGMTRAKYFELYGNSMSSAEIILGRARVAAIFKAEGLPYD